MEFLDSLKDYMGWILFIVALLFWIKDAKEVNVQKKARNQDQLTWKNEVRVAEQAKDNWYNANKLTEQEKKELTARLTKLERRMQVVAYQLTNRGIHDETIHYLLDTAKNEDAVTILGERHIDIIERGGPH